MREQNLFLQTDREIVAQTVTQTHSKKIDRQTDRQAMINQERKCKTLTMTDKSKSHKKAKIMNSDRQTDR